MSFLCGCYYHIASPVYEIRYTKHYLPLLDSSAHATILSTTSTITLKQTFTNPSTTENIKECVYTFPLYDGVSVVGFTCKIGKKTLTGLVKEKLEAKRIFEDAVAKGETAGFLEQAPQASDVFSTKLGNIPAGKSVMVEITYIGELKHYETEGIRFTIPTSVAPRYGSGPFTTVHGGNVVQDDGGINIVVDVNMPEGSFIKAIQSPSHPIAVSMGTVSTATEADPLMSKASAALSLGSAALDKDFVLIINSKDVGIPKALLETHPTIPNHRALMATLVPKFSLPPSRPEIVFVADRSGSMGGNIIMLVSAMKVFLKSMPIGVKFNICSFGNNTEFLWPKSQSYSSETLDVATRHLQTFSANMGGTQTQKAIKATIDNRYTDIPLEIILLTDGDIWDQQGCFTYVDEQVTLSKGKIRVFSLGIGNGVSHALIEGLARAGNGFAQSVQLGERLDSNVVRMLRAALAPHITDYTLEVKYEQKDDDFEIIEKVTEGMKVLLSDAEKKDAKLRPTISLFDSSMSDIDMKDVEIELPKIPHPKLFRAPHKIPSLFAFSRSTVYILMSPETIQRNPTSVIFRATSVHGPLALEIPVEILSTPSQTIHQLAAKKAVQDLEEGRGWIFDAKDQAGTLIKDRYPSCFDDLVKREAVRLGEMFQVAGKWCSFVAVSANDEELVATRQAEKAGDETAAKDVDLAEEDTDEEWDNNRIGDNYLIDYSDEEVQPAGQSISLDASSSAPTEASGSTGAKRCRGRSMKNSSQPLADYQMQLMCLEQQNKKRGSMARQEQDSMALPVAQHRQAMESPRRADAPINPFASQQRQMQQATGFYPQSGQPLNNFGWTNCGDNSSSIIPRGGPPVQAQSGGLFGNTPNSYSTSAEKNAGSANFNGRSLFGGTAMASIAQPQGFPESGRGPSNQFGSLFGAPASRPKPATTSLFGASAATHHSTSSGTFGAKTPSFSMAASQPASAALFAGSNAYKGSGFDGNGSWDTSRSYSSEKQPVSTRYSSAANPFYGLPQPTGPTAPPTVAELTQKWASKSEVDRILALIELQEFEGSWLADNDEIPIILGFAIPESPNGGSKVWVTILVVLYLEVKNADEEGTWGLVVEKAREWLGGNAEGGLEGLEKAALEVVKKA